MSDERQNWTDKPLGLPTGSIRAVIAMSVIGTACYMVIMIYTIPDFFTNLIYATFGYYFGARANGRQSGK